MVVSRRPTISVLLPFHNSGQYLAAAISSLLTQTFRDFEILLLDDGSTDKSRSVLSAFDDPRIKYLRSEQNLGLSRQLNIGLEQATGTYVARMDADDISVPSRLQKQYSFLEDHPEIGICGSYAQRFDEAGTRDIWKYPIAPADVHAALFFRSSFLHPGVLMRRSIFVQRPTLRYDETLVVAQDYMFWYEALKTTNGANLPECLTWYRVSPGQLTVTKAQTKGEETRRIRLTMLRDLGLTPSRAEEEFHNSILDQSWHESREFFQAAVNWLTRLEEANRKTGVFPAAAFAEMLARYFYFQCRCATGRSFRAQTFYSQLKFGTAYSPPLPERLRVMMKSFLRR
jgi:hypothetical protein